MTFLYIVLLAGIGISRMARGTSFSGLSAPIGSECTVDLTMQHENGLKMIILVRRAGSEMLRVQGLPTMLFCLALNSRSKPRRGLVHNPPSSNAPSTTGTVRFIDHMFHIPFPAFDIVHSLSIA